MMMERDNEDDVTVGLGGTNVDGNYLTITKQFFINNTLFVFSLICF